MIEANIRLAEARSEHPAVIQRAISVADPHLGGTPPCLEGTPSHLIAPTAEQKGAAAEVKAPVPEQKGPKSEQNAPAAKVRDPRPEQRGTGPEIFAPAAQQKGSVPEVEAPAPGQNGRRSEGNATPAVAAAGGPFHLASKAVPEPLGPLLLSPAPALRPPPARHLSLTPTFHQTRHAL